MPRWQWELMGLLLCPLGGPLNAQDPELNDRKHILQADHWESQQTSHFCSHLLAFCWTPRSTCGAHGTVGKSSDVAGLS